MEQTIKINCPEGTKAVYNETTQTIEFKPVEPVRSKSWVEFCENHPDFEGEYVILTGYAAKIRKPEYMGYKTRRPYMFNDFLATKEDAEAILALIQLTRLHDEWVGDWEPKSNSKEDYDIDFDGYWAIKRADNGTWESTYYNNSYRLLCFETKNEAEDFMRCFKDLLETAKRFI